MTALIIPVENQVRELDAKLLLACVAAERGFPVILGSRTFINYAMPYLPRGVFLAKSMRSQSKRTLDLIRDLGHDIVAWDEESLVRFDVPDEYYAWRYAPDTFAVLSHLFAWGLDDAEFFQGYPQHGSAAIQVTGNPRIDLLRAEVRGYFDPEVAALRARYGDFILINTNFSFVNNFVSALNLIQLGPLGPEVGRTGRGLSFEYAIGMAAHQGAIHAHFQTLLPRLAAWFPQHTVVLRPHPSENHDIWREQLAHCPNVKVVHEGNVVPWLMACRVLLHNGCTTAVEATVLERPAVAYQPVQSRRYDYALPNGLSHVASTEDEVHERVAAILSGELALADAAGRGRLFARHLAATDGTLASDRVVDALLNAGYTAGRSRPPLRRYLGAWIRSNFRTLVKRVNMHRRGHRNSAAYHAHRFPGVTTTELNTRIARFAGQLGRFDRVRAEALSPFVFRIAATHSQ